MDITNFLSLHIQAEVSSCKERICVLENELSDIEATFAHEKHEIEDILEKAGMGLYINYVTLFEEK